jgi:DNA polymerase III gamma/tau subunit
VPHALAFTGPSGVGKTTLCRVLAPKLNCQGDDYQEVNCADSRGIDDIRLIRNRMAKYALAGQGCTRIWVLDECHRLTGDAQSILLKMLEDTPRHVYFMLATTDPDKLLKAIRTRCTTLNLKPISPADLTTLVQSVAAAEQCKMPDAVVKRIVECADGSAREAVKLLNKVIGLKTEAEQLEAVVPEGVAKQADELVRLLVWQPNTKWADLATVLKDVTDDPEQLRRRILGCARAELLKANAKTSGRAYALICAFEGNFYDSGASGLARACYEVFSDK